MKMTFLMHLYLRLTHPIRTASERDGAQRPSQRSGLCPARRGRNGSLGGLVGFAMARASPSTGLGYHRLLPCRSRQCHPLLFKGGV